MVSTLKAINHHCGRHFDIWLVEYVAATFLLDCCFHRWRQARLLFSDLNTILFRISVFNLFYVQGDSNKSMISGVWCKLYFFCAPLDRWVPKKSNFSKILKKYHLRALHKKGKILLQTPLITLIFDSPWSLKKLSWVLNNLLFNIIFILCCLSQ